MRDTKIVTLEHRIVIHLSVTAADDSEHGVLFYCAKGVGPSVSDRLPTFFLQFAVDAVNDRRKSLLVITQTLSGHVCPVSLQRAVIRHWPCAV